MGTAEKPKGGDCCPASGSDCRELQNPPAGSNSHENVSADAGGNTRSAWVTVPDDGNIPLAQGGRLLKNLGGNTPSGEDCTVLKVGTEDGVCFTKPLDSRHSREGWMYRQGAAFGALTGWSFPETDLGHPAGDPRPLPRDQSTYQLPWT